MNKTVHMPPITGYSGEWTNITVVVPVETFSGIPDEESLEKYVISEVTKKFAEEILKGKLYTIKEIDDINIFGTAYEFRAMVADPSSVHEVSVSYPPKKPTLKERFKSRWLHWAVGVKSSLRHK